MATAYRRIKFGTNDEGRLERTSPHVQEEKSGTKTYRKYRLRLHLRKLPTAGPICDIHITLPKKPNLWGEVNTDTNPATTGADNSARLGNWPATWISKYDRTTGVLDLSAPDCPPNALDQTQYLFSFWTDGKLGKVKVQMTGPGGTAVGSAGEGEDLDKDGNA
jgi:hypothetical protein